MVAIRTQDLGLTYRLRRKLTLSRHDRHPRAMVAARSGGQMITRGSKRYVQALDGVSFELSAGDRLGDRKSVV